MEEQTNVDIDYIKGFNTGYLLANHDPELAKQLTVHPNGNNLYFEGLAAGKLQYEQEIKEWTKSFSRGSKQNDRDINRER